MSRRMCEKPPRRRIRPVAARLLLSFSILLLPCICLTVIWRNLLVGTLGLQSFALPDDWPHRDLKPRFEKAVHIVNTRFMQGQPTLRALGGARIELFKTFCLPTMIHQTTNDFLWAILVDPDLDYTLLDELIRLVKPYPHFFIIKLNAREINLERFDFSLIATGDENLLVQAHREMKSKVYLQTRLDADDGLATILIEQLQTNAVERIMSGTDPITRDSWILLCVMTHFEWHYDLHSNQTSDVAGWIRTTTHASYCVTPGLTIASAPAVNRAWKEGNIPDTPHDTIPSRMSPCQDSHPACFQVLNEIKAPAAIRSRTPASSWMKDVGTREKTNMTTKETWTFMERQFAIDRITLIRTRNYLVGNNQAIAKENLESQCSGINSCKNHVQQKLRAAITALDSNATAVAT